MTNKLDGRVLDALFSVINSRKTEAQENSYTAKLFAGGPELAGRKLNEEAVETLIAAMQNNGEEVIKEAADVLYHLLVVLAGSDVTLEDVYVELARRDGVSGLDEKASRKK